MRDKLLAIDLGTTACKALILSQDMRILGTSYAEYPLLKGDKGEVEQDVHIWWKLTKQVIKEAKEKAEVEAEEIKALSVSSQGISFVPLDDEGQPLMNAICWLDRRAESQIGKIEDKFTNDEIFHLTGRRIDAIYGLPKLLWLRENNPRLFEQTNKFLMAEDYLLYKFTGEFITDHSIASGSLLYDIRETNWSPKLLDEFSIPREKLPNLEWSGIIVGEVNDKIAEETGLAVGTSVVLGGQDQKCAALGAGMDAGKIGMSLGTASAILATTAKPSLDGRMRIPCCAYLLKDHWILEGVVSTSGASYRWFRDNLGGEEKRIAKIKGTDPYDELNELAKNSPAGSRGIFFYPHLASASSPYWKANVKGAFYGITLSTDKADMVRAVLEGIVFQLKANLDIVQELSSQVESVILFGGGAKSPFFCQLIANILGKRLQILETVEMALIGAGMLAGIGSGLYRDYDDALRQSSIKTIIVEPEDEEVGKYQRIYEDYLEIQDKLLS